MIWKFQCATAAMSILASTITGFAGIQTAVPPDTEIRRILAERVGDSEKDIGIVVGVIEPNGRRIISYGHRNAGDPRPLNGDTVFEIASVTKVFTALVLADMVERKEVALADPVAKYLPADFKVPERNGRTIALVDLATHTSGLPFMPEDAPALNDPAAAKYSVADLKRYLAGYQLKTDIGSEWSYCNLGYWLLGEALSSRGGMKYEELVRNRVIGPLNLTNTDFLLSATMKANLAAGHDAALQPAPGFSALGAYSLMPAGGGLYSTANDLLTVLSVAMDYERSPLTPAMKITLNTRRPAGSNNEQALGWTVVGKDEVIFRDGSSFGYASWMGWDPKNRIGVVVLCNQIGDVADIGRHLLRPDFPLTKPTNTKHTEITLDPKLLDSYTGRYEAKGEGIFTVARENDFLTIESPADWGLPKLRIRPENRENFFAAELPLRVTFLRRAVSSEGGKIDNHGGASGLLIYPPRGQKAVPATKLSPDK